MEIRIDQLIPHPLKEFGFEESEIWKNNYTFSSGKIYQIIAHSGVGKSTLINILYGDRKDYDGNVFFDNQNINQFNLSDWTKVRRSKLAYVFQGLHLFEELTLMENIQLKNSLTQHQSENQIIDWIDKVGLKNHLHQKAVHLSYGQRQRIAVIRALCQPFDFLLLDEPFSHLDKENQTLLLDLITEEAYKKNAGILFTSLHEIHDKRLENVIKL
ncbi:ABC-type lipoprotein export system, ATPase component [Chishuiella changwenlii]|jgi:ABC-type lipoprotein export system ATPase subunit|uniref:ABC transporter ATP-binding protein n=1 Tax=Chishuiella changwenlii TaxID=1434701 RepID=A0A1M7CJK8_9FLAO|nr:ATP-binding cassette domain-containing protein [Chishuiella changwenlii]GGE96760.1 ABC transporter ATP-binding protein [Chishuiella changwenlii]SHL67384.1 ABC-type lipoprotein export system, ATPase component [Chishuiella changwenlii]